MYPPSEDIYNKYREVKDIDPEEVIDHIKHIPKPEPADDEIKELNDDEIRELGEDGLHILDLDIPGADLDDDLEEIGSEDEENNYYSIGGDNHHDLEEEGEHADE